MPVPGSAVADLSFFFSWFSSQGRRLWSSAWSAGSSALELDTLRAKAKRINPRAPTVMMIVLLSYALNEMIEACEDKAV